MTKSHKLSSCIVPKKLPVPSSEKLKNYRDLYNCFENKCEKYIIKENEIFNTCLDKTINMNLKNKINDKKKMSSQVMKCYSKLGLISNTEKKVNCRLKQCSDELDKSRMQDYDKYDPKVFKEISKFNDEQSKYLRKLYHTFPKYKEQDKINDKINLISFALNNCKNEEERSKLQKRKKSLLNKKF